MQRYFWGVGRARRPPSASHPSFTEHWKHAVHRAYTYTSGASTCCRCHPALGPVELIHGHALAKKTKNTTHYLKESNLFSWFSVSKLTWTWRVLSQGHSSLFFHHSPHLFNLYKLCTRHRLLNRNHSAADKHSRSLFKVLNPPTSCTFSTRASCFCSFWQSAHRRIIDKTQTHTLQLHITSTRRTLSLFFFFFQYTYFGGSLHTETPWLIFSESNFLLMKQLHCKDVFLLLALSSHKPCDFKRYRSDFGSCHPTDSTRVSHLDHTWCHSCIKTRVYDLLLKQ